MPQLSHEMAYHALREAIDGKRDPYSFSCEDIALERLRLALIDPELSTADRTVRLRHALRYADTALAASQTKHQLVMPQTPEWWPNRKACSLFGLSVRAGGAVEAEPWQPSWLKDIPNGGVDANAARAAPRRWNHLAPNADPWITSSLGFSHFRGSGQALAVRSGLHMPNNKTLVVLLPTGEGKSLVFQALACAYQDNTVAVVVPTVALALDHAAALHKFQKLQPDHPHAYIGGQEDDNERIRGAITSGSQGLLFAAPESFVSKLRQPLRDAARDGNLAALVIDEAHLVDAWGTDFRSEFQLLSALAAELRELAPQNRKPRIICLSATVTQEALNALERLFSPNEPIAIVPAARLRPEPDIWIAPISPSFHERQERVLDAVRHLPRPAILYVTEQLEAEKWLAVLREAGFSRIGMVHGGTPTNDRKAIIESWRKGALDLVVGTSAFGLGIDYPHVRTIIHACVPESLDRYYQEIGRSGRDNCASIALLIPAATDFATAESLASKKVITIEKGLARWKAMFATKASDGGGQKRFLVDPATSPGYDPDMRSGRSEDWNARVLNLMSRSGLIRLSGLRYDAETQKSAIAIDILDDGHLDPSIWERRVEPTRLSILKASWAGLLAMRKLIEDEACPTRLFRDIYQLHHAGLQYDAISACGGCSHCRSTREEGWFAEWPNSPAAPFPIGQLHPRLEVLTNSGRCFIERDTDRFDRARERRRLREVIEGLWDMGLRKCIVLGDIPDTLREVLSHRPWCMAASATDKVLTSNGLPPGPELVWVAADHMPSAHHLLPLPPGEERFFLLPTDPRDPNNPERPLADRYALTPFNKFHDWLLP